MKLKFSIKKVFEERTDFLKDKQLILQKKLLSISKQIKDLSLELDNIGNLISENKIYQESIDYYKKYTDELNNYKYQQGELSQIKRLKNDIKNINEVQLVNNFNQAEKTIEAYEKKIKIISRISFPSNKKLFMKKM